MVYLPNKESEVTFVQHKFLAVEVKVCLEVTISQQPINGNRLKPQIIDTEQSVRLFRLEYDKILLIGPEFTFIMIKIMLVNITLQGNMYFFLRKRSGPESLQD